MPNLYIDHFQYQRSPSGLESASLLGNSMRFTSLTAAAATTIPNTPNLTVQLNQYDQVTIFDGPNSEVVIVAATATVGASSFTIQAPGLQFQHAAGVPMCSNGVLGSLADQIVSACDWLESDFTYQSLFQNTYTSEILPMPSMRASIDNQNALVLRPTHFPITAINSIVLQAQQGQTLTLAVAQAFIDASAQTVRVPILNATGPTSQVFFPQQPMSRTANMWATIGYTAGFVPAALPPAIRDGAVLLVSEILRRRYNPTGADQVRSGGVSQVAMLRGDMTGESLFVKQAARKLARYKVRSM